MIHTVMTLLGLSLCSYAAPASPILVPLAPISAHSFHSTVDVPVGHNVTIDGVTTYVSLPKGRFDPSVAVVQLMDVFGLAKTDNMLLTDQWAQAGFATYAPDYFNGDPLPADGNLTAWIVNHGEAQTTPPLLVVIKHLRDSGVRKIAVTGYCFGGLYATRLTQNNTVEVATMAHPSLLVIPNDYDLVKKVSRVPVQIQSADLDTDLTPVLAAEIDQAMVGYLPGYNRTAWAGVGHGFAVTVANISDPVQVAAKQGAFNSSLHWIKTHL